jgi:hypothetical protein
MRIRSKSIASAGVALGLAVAALSVAPAAWAQDDMHGVDMLHPGAQFAPRMPSGLSPAGPLDAPAASGSGAMGGSEEPALRQAPGTPQIHPPTRAPNFSDACSGANVSPTQQIGSDKTFCGFGKR